jgi:hypothetical protein
MMVILALAVLRAQSPEIEPREHHASAGQYSTDEYLTLARYSAFAR